MKKPTDPIGYVAKAAEILFAIEFSHLTGPAEVFQLVADAGHFLRFADLLWSRSIAENPNAGRLDRFKRLNGPSSNVGTIEVDEE
ncbi:MAG: hypothetical protein ACQKBT_11915 [Puniceicoccales bacterium]